MIDYQELLDRIASLERTVRNIGIGQELVLGSLHVLGDINADGELVGAVVADPIETNTVSERTDASGVTVDGVLLKDSEVTTDVINEKTGAAGVTIDGMQVKDAVPRCDNIYEDTAAAGVTIDGMQIKDSVPRCDYIYEKTGAQGVSVDGVLLKDAEVTTDVIHEKTGAAGVTADGVLLKDSEVTTDVINEKTGAAGVTIDSVVCKDGGVAGTSIDLGGTTLLASRALTVDTGGVFNIVLASASGDDFTVDTDKLVVEGDTGNVGIGEATPDQVLTIFKSGESATKLLIESSQRSDWQTTGGELGVIHFSTDGSGTGKPVVGKIKSYVSNSTYQLRLGTHNNEDVLNIYGVNVGIGTTGPGEALDVIGNPTFGTVTERLSMGSGAFGFNRRVATGAIYDSGKYAYQFQHTGSATQGSDYLALQVYNAAGANITTKALAIDGYGNVGIGTTGPGHQLQVGDPAGGAGVGRMVAVGGEAFVGWGDRAEYEGNNTHLWGWYASGGSTHLYDVEGAANRITVEAGTGRAGFGAVSYAWPAADGDDGQVLKTDGGGVLAWIDATGEGTPEDHGALTGLGDDDHPHYPATAHTETITGAWTFSNLVGIGAAPQGGYQLKVYSAGVPIKAETTAGGDIQQWFVSGTVKAAVQNAGTYWSASDSRLKEDQREISGREALDAVYGLRPVKFDWITGGHSVGFVGQQVAVAAPLAARKVEGTWGVSSQLLIPYLVAAIKELNAQMKRN